jgi:hypothetical protein
LRDRLWWVLDPHSLKEDISPLESARAFPLEQNMQAPIAETAAFMGNGLHALAKSGIVRPSRLVSHGHAATADGFTRPPFAHPECVPEMRDSFPLARGRHHFFPKRSFNAALSSMASASNP